MSRVNNWAYLLSKEVVNHWLNNQEVELPSLEEAMASLGLTGSLEVNQLSQALAQEEPKGQEEPALSLFQELEKVVKRVKENYSSEPNSLEKLFKIESVLFNWYYGDGNEPTTLSCLHKLELKSQKLRIEVSHNFQEFINSISLKSSPNAGFNYLSQIGAFLFNLNGQYQRERQKCILQENGGKKSYNFLISKIIKSESNQEINSNYQSGINALAHIYKCKIKAEIAEGATQIIRGLIQDYQWVSDSLIKSSCFLGNLQDSFSLKEAKSNLSIATFFDELCLIKSPDDLRQELENDLGVPLNRWVSSGYISIEEINKILLLKITPIAKDIFDKLAQEFAPQDNSQTEENKPFQLLSYSKVAQ